jgi:hypothetical protein
MKIDKAVKLDIYQLYVDGRTSGRIETNASEKELNAILQEGRFDDPDILASKLNEMGFIAWRYYSK